MRRRNRSKHRPPREYRIMKNAVVRVLVYSTITIAGIQAGVARAAPVPGSARSWIHGSYS